MIIYKPDKEQTRNFHIHLLKQMFRNKYQSYFHITFASEFWKHPLIEPIGLRDDPSFHTATLYNMSKGLPMKLEFKYFEILLFHVIAIILLIGKKYDVVRYVWKIDLIVFKGVYQKGNWNVLTTTCCMSKLLFFQFRIFTITVSVWESFRNSNVHRSNCSK